MSAKRIWACGWHDCGVQIIDLYFISSALVSLEPKPRVNMTRLAEKHLCFSAFGQPMVVQIHS
jgi:hypothetical protein